MNSNEFFDSAVKTGKKVLRRAGEVACDVADAVEVRYRIAELQSSVARKQKALGKLACEIMDGGELTMDEGMQKLYNEITELKKSIAALKEDL